MDFAKQGRPMTMEGMDAICGVLGVGEPEIWAVLTVETRGFGFLPDRRPQILFERHVFSRLTDRRFDADNPDISSRNPGGYKGGAAEYARLEKAMALDHDGALKSASWGLPQVMGFNHETAGFATVVDMVNAMVRTEDAHLDAMANFIKGNAGCLNAIRRRSWATFAASYNGPEFRRNEYDTRLAAAFEKHKTFLPDIGLRVAQVALTYLGFDPGTVDGLRGRRTRGALVEFQEQCGLPDSGELTEQTEEELVSAAFPR